MRSPVGPWAIEGNDEGVTRVYMPHERTGPNTPRASRVVKDAQRQLEEYFAKTRRAFDLALITEKATSFQRECWAVLADIPYGAVATYAQVARSVGRPFAARAVGNANHANPWPIFIPCHRVVASNGLGGYGGGIAVKEFLLELEDYLVAP